MKRTAMAALLVGSVSVSLSAHAENPSNVMAQKCVWSRPAPQALWLRRRRPPSRSSTKIISPLVWRGRSIRKRPSFVVRCSAGALVTQQEWT